MNKQIQDILGKVIRDGLRGSTRGTQKNTRGVGGRRFGGRRSIGSILGSLIAAGIIGWFTQCRDGQTNTPSAPQPHLTESAPAGSTKVETSPQVKSLKQFNAKLEFTKHASCRMKCRKISQSDVKEVLISGGRNPKKSDLSATPCPLDAMEGRTKEGQMIRVIVGRCGLNNKIVTVIDLGEDRPCECP